MPVTPRQRQVHDYLCRYFDAHRHAPTIAEIGAHFKLSSPIHCPSHPYGP